MLSINEKFAIWCARKCLYLWNPPQAVFAWLDDPENINKADVVSDAVFVVNATVLNESWSAAWAAVYAANAIARTPAVGVPMSLAVVANSEWAVDHAAEALDITIDDLKHDFVSTLNDSELTTTNSEWVEYVTAEIFAR